MSSAGPTSGYSSSSNTAGAATTSAATTTSVAATKDDKRSYPSYPMPPPEYQTGGSHDQYDGDKPEGQQSSNSVPSFSSPTGPPNGEAVNGDGVIVLDGGADGGDELEEEEEVLLHTALAPAVAAPREASAGQQRGAAEGKAAVKQRPSRRAASQQQRHRGQQPCTLAPVSYTQQTLPTKKKI